MPVKIILDEDFIKLHHSLGKSANWIALELNVSKNTILRSFKKLNLFPNFKLGSF